MTLTQTARNFKLFTKLGGIVLVVLIVGRSILLVYDIVIRIPGLPPQEPIADKLYGQIPPLVIERVTINLPTNYTTYLDLVQQQLPAEPMIANVFPILKAPYGFLSSDRARDLARTFGFFAEPIKTSTTQSLWTGINQTLTINDQTLNFRYQYNWEADPSVFVPGRFTSQNGITNQAEGKMSKHNVVTKENSNFMEKKQVYLLKYQNRRLQPTQRIMEASAARVDFQRKDVTYTLNTEKVEQYPFVSPHYLGSLTHIVLSGLEDRQTKTLKITHTLWHFNLQHGSTYPLITSTQAWENIQKDPSLFTVYLGNFDLGPMDRSTTSPLIQTIKVKEVFLAYFNPEKEQDFIQPIWVFKGKGLIAEGGELDWVGYVPAVHPDDLYFPDNTTSPGV